MTARLVPVEKHKRKILSAVKGNETRNECRTYKPDPPRRRHAVRRIRFDTYNLGELMAQGRWQW